MKIFYTSINEFMWNHPFIKSCTHFASRFTPYMVAIFYALYLLKIYLDKVDSLIRITAEPLTVLFVSLTLRMLITRKRPAEVYNFTPIDGSKRTGNCFPSIHVAITLAIALAVLRTGPNMGLLLSVLCAVITIARLLSGINFISDIVASIVIALLVNLI